MNNRTYIKNTALLFAAMAVTKVIGAVFKIPLANILGGTGMGYFSAAYGLYSPIFALTAAGVPTVIMRLTAQNVALGRHKNALRIKHTAALMFTVIGTVGTAAVLLLAVPFSNTVACSPESAPAVAMIAPAVLFCCVGAVIRGYYEGMSDVLPSAVANIVEAASRAIAGLILSYAAIGYAKYRFNNGLPVFGKSCATYEQAYDIAVPWAAAFAVLAVTISEICGLAALIIQDRRKRKKLPYNNEPPVQQRKDIARRILKDAIPIAVFALVMNCFSFIDLLTVTRTITSSAANAPDYFRRAFSDVLAAGIEMDEIANFMYGSYTGISMSLFMLIPSFAGMSEKTALPEIAAAWERNNADEVSDKICFLMKTNALIGFPACFGAATLAEPVLNMLYPSRAAEVSVCTNSFTVLCISGMLMVTTSALSGVFQAIGKPLIPLVTMSIAVAVKAILNPILLSVPQLNITGAALATAGGYLAAAIAGLAIMNRYVRAISLLRTYILPLLYSLVCSASASAVYHVLAANTNQPIATVSAVSAGVLVYVILLIINGAFRTTPIIKWVKTKKIGKGLAKSQKIG